MSKAASRSWDLISKRRTDLLSKIVSTAGIAVLLTACNGAGTVDGNAARQPVTSGASAPRGQVYFLPMRLFQVEVEYELKDCRVDEHGQLQLEIGANAAVTDHLLPDPTQQQVIAYKADSALTKLDPAKFDLYDNGTLKGINVSFEDRTASVLGNVVKGVLRIFAIASGVPTIPFTAPTTDLLDGAARQERTTADCAADALTALAKVKKFRDDLKTEKTNDKKREKAGAKVIKLTNDIATATAALAAANAAKDPAKISAAEARVKKVDSDLKAAKAEVKRLGKSKTAEIIKKIDAIRQSVLVRRVGTIFKPSISVNPQTIKISIPAREKGRWLTKKGICEATDYTGPCGPDVSDDVIREQLAKLGALRAEVTLDSFGTPSSHPDKATVPGDIVYRQPVFARLQVCRDSCVFPTEGGVTDVANRLFDKMYAIPQMGPLASFPVQTKGIFQKKSVVLGFSIEGTLASVSYTSDSSAERATQVFSDVTDKVGAYLDARKTTRGAAKTAAADADIANIKKSTERHEELLKEAKAKKALEEYLANPVVDQ